MLASMKYTYARRAASFGPQILNMQKISCVALDQICENQSLSSIEKQTSLVIT